VYMNVDATFVYTFSQEPAPRSTGTDLIDPAWTRTTDQENSPETVVEGLNISVGCTYRLLQTVFVEGMVAAAAKTRAACARIPLRP